ncbi:hypothetical protein E2320_020973 [Naja naja]|nr:hypothetical protein E2320_020973 [Naja naja]
MATSPQKSPSSPKSPTPKSPPSRKKDDSFLGKLGGTLARRKKAKEAICDLKSPWYGSFMKYSAHLQINIVSRYWVEYNCKYWYSLMEFLSQSPLAEKKLDDAQSDKPSSSSPIHPLSQDLSLIVPECHH